MYEILSKKWLKKHYGIRNCLASSKIGYQRVSGLPKVTNKTQKSIVAWVLHDLLPSCNICCFWTFAEKNPSKITLLVYWVVIAGFSSTNITVLQ